MGFSSGQWCALTVLWRQFVSHYVLGLSLPNGVRASPPILLAIIDPIANIVLGTLEPELMKKYNMKSVEDSAAAILKVVVEATREKDGGRFLSHDGTMLEW